MNLSLPATSSAPEPAATAARAGSARAAGIDASFATLLAQRAQTGALNGASASPAQPTPDRPQVRAQTQPRARESVREAEHRAQAQPPQREALRQREDRVADAPAEPAPTRGEQPAAPAARRRGADHADSASTPGQAPEAQPVQADAGNATTSIADGVAATDAQRGGEAAEANTDAAAAAVDLALAGATVAPGMPAGQRPATAASDAAEPVSLAPTLLADRTSTAVDAGGTTTAQTGATEAPAPAQRHAASAGQAAADALPGEPTAAPQPGAGASENASLPALLLAATSASPERTALPGGMSPAVAAIASMAPVATGAFAAAGPGGTVVAGAPAHASIHAPLLGEQFAPALGARLVVLAQQGVQRAELQINPADLGPISVDIALDGARIAVDFGADLAATRQRLESSLPELASALREAGLTLSGGGVHEHRRHREGGQARAAAAPAARGGVAAAEPAASGAAAARFGAQGVVDLYA